MSTPSDSPGEDTGPTSDQDMPPRVPRWVKVLAVIAGVLALLALIVVLTGLGGEHGPGRHTGAGVTAEETAPGGAL